MEQPWMIFAHESNANHMWYAGGDKYIDLDNGDQVWDMDPEVLDAVLNSKKKYFTHNKTRYVVVARGRRYEP